MAIYARPLPLPSLQGLRPRAWLCVGGGFAREDVKALVLKSGQGFVGEAITTLTDLCARIADREAPLGPLARQEVLRILLAEPRISARMSELKRLRRQGNFFKRLDVAVQAGRLSAAHADEEAVFSQYLEQKAGANPVREEVRALARAYEAWLEGASLLDPPLLIAKATEALLSTGGSTGGSTGWPARLAKPETIYLLSAQAPENLEKSFWDALQSSTGIAIERLEVNPDPSADPVAAEATHRPRAPVSWERWHTVDDAADALADQLAAEVARHGTLEGCVVLIPEHTAVRRSLKRALQSAGVLLADARDPTRIRWEEPLKWAMLPLELAGKGYERTKVISFLRTFFSASDPHPDFPLWVSEINARGIRAGLSAYAGGSLIPVHQRLSEIEQRFGGRRTCAELAESHLSYLRMQVGEDPERAWVVQFFEQLWKDFVADTARVDGDRSAPLRYWLERLQARVSEASAPVERLKPELGLDVYRLQQAPVVFPRKLWFLGLPPQWLTGEGVGDYWFSERERELLAGEFGVRSAIQVRQERLECLRAWCSRAERIEILDSQYDVDGRERESVAAVVREFFGSGPASADSTAGFQESHDSSDSIEPLERGCHPRWSASYGVIRTAPPQTVKLSPLPLGLGGRIADISATAIDSYSRCPFVALARHRWRLKEVPEPDTELWPDVRGNLLHEAVRILIASRDAEGRFARTSSEALDEAWNKVRPKGLLRGKRVESYVRGRLKLVLDAFLEKEREYHVRSGARVLGLENIDFRLDLGDYTLIGKPDRIDEVAGGLFVLDYKTSSAPAHGSEMLEQGYRLQLPFYALAAQAQFKKPVVGVQFVELTKKSARGSGMFFKEFNGKEAGKLTQLTTRSKSLLSVDPGQAWARMEEHLLAHAKAYAQGVFDAKAKRGERECKTCRVSDLCGYRRLLDPAGGSEGAAPNE